MAPTELACWVLPIPRPASIKALATCTAMGRPRFGQCGPTHLCQPHCVPREVARRRNHRQVGADSPYSRVRDTDPFSSANAFKARQSAAYLQSSRTFRRRWNLTWGCRFDNDQFIADHYVTGITFIPSSSLRFTVEAYLKQYKDYPVSTQFPALSLASVGETFSSREILFALTSAGRGRARDIEIFAEKKRVGPGGRINNRRTLSWRCSP